MRIIKNLDEMIETARGWLAGGSVGFVPTRGYLHAGHFSLIREARRTCENCVVSILLSPLQFATLDDFLSYPRDLERDIQVLEQEQVDVVFAPDVGELFPPNFATFLHPTGPVAERLEGAYHAASLRGYATVMMKLFELVRPDIAYFGQKNYQYFALVQQIVRDLNVDIKLQMLPTVRDVDGLAYGSRMHQISADERKALDLLYSALRAAQILIDQGERRLTEIEKTMADYIATSSLLHPEYAVACDPVTFERPGTAVGGMLPDTLTALLLVTTVTIRKMRFTDNILMYNGRWFA
jgi:pantoate--beta-alanine ligase